MTYPEAITPAEAAERLAAEEPGFVLLDVREADELLVASVAGVRHVPMNDVPVAAGEWPKTDVIAVLCHSGRRSHAVTEYLRRAGFDRACNVVGGIDRWSVEVDASIPRY